LIMGLSCRSSKLTQEIRIRALLGSFSLRSLRSKPFGFVTEEHRDNINIKALRGGRASWKQLAFRTG
jgi:hypothetical protein